MCLKISQTYFMFLKSISQTFLCHSYVFLKAYTDFSIGFTPSACSKSSYSVGGTVTAQHGFKFVFFKRRIVSCVYACVMHVSCMCKAFINMQVSCLQTRYCESKTLYRSCALYERTNYLACVWRNNVCLGLIITPEDVCP